MMAQKSRPGFMAGQARRRRILAGAGSALAITVSLAAADTARAQYQPAYGNPLAGGPVPYSMLQGGGAQQQYYGQAYTAQPYGYQQPYGAGAPGSGSIVYDRSVLGGGGYQPPFYAGVAGQQGFQGAQYGAPAAYGAPVVQAPPGVYGQVGGLYVPGPQAPVSQLYIQPGVAAPGFAQTQVGVANGTLPPAPAPVTAAPTSAPQVAAAQSSPALPPAPPAIAPAPAPTTGTASSGAPTVPRIVEDASIAAPPTPPAPPAPPAPTQPPPIVEASPDSQADIVPPPPPPAEARTDIATATPPPQPPVERADPAPPPAPPPAPAEIVPIQPDEIAVVESPPAPPPTPAPAPAPAPAPTSTADVGGIALSIAFSGGVSELPAASEAELRTIAQRMLADDSLRLTIRAYAEGTAEEPSPPRRLSLSRALAVRSFLIEQGIRGPRMDVRALGHRTEPPRDRVDLVLASQ